MTAIDISTRLEKSYGWDWQNLETLAKDIGYRFIRQHGSHAKYWHPKCNTTLIIPHNKDLKRTDSNIIRALKETWNKLKAGECVMAEYVLTNNWKQNLRIIRTAHNFSMKDIGMRMGMPQSGYSAVAIINEFEMGKKSKMTHFEFVTWCNVFGLKPEEQLWMTEFEEREKIVEQRKTRLLKGRRVPEIADIKTCLLKERVPDVTKVETTIPVTVVPYSTSIPIGTDYLTTVEVMVERFKELHKLMLQAEASKPEYEKLKTWIEEGGKLLDL